MKKFLIGSFTTLLIILGGSHALGMRFHADAFKQRMGYENRDFRKFNLTSGRSFVGEILKETPDSYKVTFEGGAMVFSKSEIASMEPVDPKTSNFGDYADEIVLLPRKPVLTFRKEDSLFYKAPVKKIRYIDSNLRKEEDEEDSSGEGKLARTMENAMKYAEKSQKQVDEKRKEQEAMMAKLESEGQ
jgi:hypothetical protein